MDFSLVLFSVREDYLVVCGDECGAASRVEESGVAHGMIATNPFYVLNFRVGMCGLS